MICKILWYTTRQSDIRLVTANLYISNYKTVTYRNNETNHKSLFEFPKGNLSFEKWKVVENFWQEVLTCNYWLRKIRNILILAFSQWYLSICLSTSPSRSLYLFLSLSLSLSVSLPPSLSLKTNPPTSIHPSNWFAFLYQVQYLSHFFVQETCFCPQKIICLYR